MNITEDEWVLLIKALEILKGVEDLTLHCAPDSRDIHPFQAAADAVSNAYSLWNLKVDVDGISFPRDLSGLIVLPVLFESTQLPCIHLI